MGFVKYYNNFASSFESNAYKSKNQLKMKKITFLLLCIIPLLGVVTAQTAEELLERAAMVGNPLGIEPENLFTAEEQALIHEHFNSEIPENTLDKLAIGDVYAVQLSGSCTPRGFCKFTLDNPSGLSLINPTNTNFYAGDQDESGNLYGVAVEGFIDEVFTFVKIDRSTGVETVISTLDFFPTGLSWNNANSTMYVLGSYVNESSLFTIDLETGETTLIGQTPGALGIWLAIDQSGNAYMADVGTDNLYSVNLETGVRTLIGSIGVDIVFAQDADFDPETGILYTVGYHGGGVNRLYSVNTTTGIYTSLGNVNNDCAQIGLVNIYGQSTVGVSENALQGFTFYPNPSTSGILNLQSVKNIQSVTICNLLGQQIIESIINGTNSQLDISVLNTGVYILKVESNGETGTYKLIKN